MALKGNQQTPKVVSVQSTKREVSNRDLFGLEDLHMIFTLNLMLQNAQRVLKSSRLNFPVSVVLSRQWFNQWGEFAKTRDSQI